MTKIYIAAYSDPGSCQFSVADDALETVKMPQQIVSGFETRDWSVDVVDRIVTKHRLCEELQLDDWEL